MPLIRSRTGWPIQLLAALAGSPPGPGEGADLDPDCRPARRNLALLDGIGPETSPSASRHSGDAGRAGRDAVKVAILSFLFNWPSTGGGIVHTVELAHFLARAGYDVRHFHA